MTFFKGKFYFYICLSFKGLTPNIQGEYQLRFKELAMECGPGGSLQSPENIQFFLGTTITFQKLPTFLAGNFTLYGLFHQELVVPIISEVAFSTLLYSIFGKIKQNIAFQ